MERLYSICWNLTSRCVNNCRFCFRDIAGIELDVETNIQIMDKLLQYGIKKVSFTGGEVMLYENVWKLVEYAHSNHVYTNIITSGNTKVNDIYNNLIKNVDCLTLPLDALDKRIQEQMGRLSTQSAEVTKILAWIQHCGVSMDVKINTVVTSMNLLEIDALYDFLCGQRIKQWKLFEFTPLRYHAIENRESFLLERGKFGELMRDLQLKNNERGKPIQIIFQDVNKIENSYIVIRSDGTIASTIGGVQKVIGDLKSEELECIMKKINFDYEENTRRHVNM